MKKLLITCLCFIVSIPTWVAAFNSDDVKDAFTPGGNNSDIKWALLGDNIWWKGAGIIEINSGSDVKVLEQIFGFITDSIFGLLMVAAVGMFFFIWVRLAFARWNPEEFKTAMNSLVYAIVWLAVVSVAWAAVKLVAGLNI